MTATTRKDRHETRVAFDTRVHVIGPGERETVLMSADWSSRSVFLRTREPLTPGTPVRIFVMMGHPLRRLTLSGKVVRSVPHVSGVPSAREGMAVVFETREPHLDLALHELARKRQTLEPSSRSGPAGDVLVACNDALADAVARMLEEGGHEVVRVSDEYRLARLLAGRTAPGCVVLSTSSGPLLRPLALAVSQGCSFDLVVALGVATRGLPEELRAPVLLIPAAWQPDKINASIRRFLKGAPEALEITRNSEERHASWFLADGARRAQVAWGG